MKQTLVTSRRGAIVRRSIVEQRPNARDYLENLRWDFWYACGYCHITECEAAGIGFQVDHYKCENRYPQLKAQYANLMYACSECNALKSNHPSEKLEKLGYRIFRPDEDDPDEHFRVNPTDATRIQGTTGLVGEFSEHALRLNRDALLRLRRLRSEFADSRTLMIRGTRVLEGLAVEKIPTKQRLKYLEGRKSVLAAGRKANERVDATLLREINRSELLDKDPKPRDAVERRAYLKRLKASSIPPPERSDEES